MIINVSQITEEDGLKVEHLYPEGQPALGTEDIYVFDRPALKFEATRDGVKLRLAGTLSASVRVFCGRCLAAIDIPVDEGFDLMYLPPLTSTREGDERELAMEDLDVGFYQNDVIDLDDLVREQIELALPMTRLCSDDCRGLCPACGENLNQAQCSCKTELIDPRLAALKDLKLSS